MSLPVTSFWEYSNSVYHKPGVERTLLLLQQRFGVDVNVVLFCSWVALFRHLRLPAEGIATLISHTDVWQNETVRPLRRVRQRLKSSSEGMPREEVQALRERVQELELHAEHIEQNFLESESHRIGVSAAPSEPRQAAVYNVIGYFRYLSVELDGQTNDQFMSLLSALLNVTGDAAVALWRSAETTRAGD